MPMSNNGLSKLLEECGELSQIAAKKLACMNTDDHWDGGGSLRRRMEEELADVQAASALVIQTFGLDENAIRERSAAKLALFQKWHADPNN